MNIRVELESKPTKDQIKSIAAYACSHPSRFQKLMNCFFDSHHRLVLAASWVLTQAITLQPTMLEPYFPDLINHISNPNNAKHLIRNSLRILEIVKIPESFHGAIMNACFDFVQNPKTEIAIKAYSLTIIYQLSITYPEIQDELKYLIEEQWDHETPAFKSRGRKILAQINKSRKKI